MFIRRVVRPPSVSQFNEHLHQLQETATLLSQSNFILKRATHWHNPALRLCWKVLSSSALMCTFQGFRFEHCKFSHEVRLLEVDLTLVERCTQHLLMFTLLLTSNTTIFISHDISSLHHCKLATIVYIKNTTPSSSFRLLYRWFDLKVS